MAGQSANAFGPTGTSAETLNGLFKEAYADKLENLIPEGMKLTKLVKFLAKEKMPGNLYH